MMKIMLVIKNAGLDLATAMKQFALSVIVYRKITERKEIGYYAINTCKTAPSEVK